MKTHLILIASMLLAQGAVAQNSFSTLEEQMTGKEFTAAGLGKLSDEELAALNEWLRSHSVGTLSTPVTQGVDQRGFEDQALQEIGATDVVSKIEGPFKGWDGETVFQLQNGMIWKQSESSTFAIAEVDSPTVTIERGVFNVWYLSVDGYNRRVKVKRLQ